MIIMEPSLESREAAVLENLTHKPKMSRYCFRPDRTVTFHHVVEDSGKIAFFLFPHFLWR